MSPAAPARLSRGDWWLIAGWIAAAAFALAGTVQDTDPYWQIRAGEENLDGVPLARPDTWSWAPVDGLFYPNSPAWNVVLALAWRALGPWGLYLLTAATIAASLAIVAWLARRIGARTVPLVVVILAVTAAALPVFSPRAALPAHLLFLIGVAAAVRWSDRASRVPATLNVLVALAFSFVLSATGNWVHLSWPLLAVASLVAWSVLWGLDRRLTTRTTVALVGGGGVGLLTGVLVGPYGTDVLERSSAVVDACRGIVTEWITPFEPAFGLRWWPLAISVVAVTVVAVAWCVRALRVRHTDPRLPLIAALTTSTVPYAVAGLGAIRFVMVAYLTIAPVLAVGVSMVAVRIHGRVTPPPPDARYLRRRLPEWTSGRFWRVVLWLVLALVAPVAVVAGSNHAVPLTHETDQLLPRGCRAFGSTIDMAPILLERPDVTVWIDGRADYWGRERNLLAAGYLSRLDQQTLVPPGTTCVVLSDIATDPGLAALTAALDASPDWRRVPGTTGATLWLPAG